MQQHFLVVQDFVGPHGRTYEKGDLIVPGDTATEDMWAEIYRQVENGNIVEVEQGAGVARPSDKVEEE